MRILRITLRDFRGVLDAEVKLSPSGVTIIEGPNEVGKSSFAQALDLLFDYLDSSRHRHVVEAKPVNRDVGPWVEVELTVGEYHLVFGKRFLKRAETWLDVLAPRREQQTGRQAHERVHEILDANLDRALWSALRVEQGESLDQAALGDVRSLGAALDAAASLSVAQDSQDSQDSLVTAVAQEYARYFTPKTGKPVGEWSRVGAEVEEAREAVRVLGARIAGVETDIDRAAEIQAELSRLRAEQERAGASLAEFEARHREVVQAQARLDAAEGELASAERAVEDAARAVVERRALAADLQARTAEREVLQAEQTAAAQAVTELSAQSDAARAALDVAQERVRELEAEVRRAADDVDLLRDTEELARSQERLRRAEEAQRQLRDVRAQLETARLDDTALARVEATHATLREAQAARDASAARVVVERLGSTPVQVDGIDIVADTPLDQPVVAVRTIEIDGVARVTVRPGRDGDELAAAADHAQAALDRLLADLGVTGPAAARDAAAERRSAAAEEQRVAAELTGVLGGETLTELEVRVAALERTLAQVQARRPADRPKPAELAAAQQVHQIALDSCAEAVAGSEAVSAQARAAADALVTARQHLVRAEQRVENATAEIERVGQTLARARADRADTTLQATEATGRRRITELQAEAEQARAEVGVQNPTELEVRLTNARGVVNRLNTTQRALQDESHQVAGRLEAVQAEGLHDQLVEARGVLESAERRHASVRRRAEAAHLLHHTLLRHRDQARQRYVQPYREAVCTLGRIVFGPTFDVEIGPELEVVNRTLNGATVPFAGLSSGAKEQLALVCRLAVSQLVSAAADSATDAAPSAGVPVIIDDALGYADPTRLDSVCAVLNHVGQTGQVIVFSCQPDRFRTIGSASVVTLRAGAAQEPSEG